MPMSLYSDEVDKPYILDDFENKLKRKSSCWSYKSARSEDDKRTRREVANNNERRRMQSINAGFEDLRKLLPYCAENEKISKASILQTTAKYIQDLRMRINSLENDLLRSSSEEKKHSFPVADTISEVPEDDHHKGCLELIENISTIEEALLDSDLKQPSVSGYTSDLGSSTSSMTSLKSCDTDIVATMSESMASSSQSQNTLEHLLMAVAQVERQEAMQSGRTSTSESTVLEPSANFVVMKPMISPFAEMIIQDAMSMHLSGHRSSKIPHKYLHRPGVVLSRSKN